jgi:hypothetical protein
VSLDVPQPYGPSWPVTGTALPLHRLRDEVIKVWRKLHNDEFHNLYCLPSIIRIIKSRRMRWTGYVAGMGVKRNTYRILVGKPEGMRPLGRPRCRWEDNNKMDLRETEWGGMDWIYLPQDRDQ